MRFYVEKLPFVASAWKYARMGTFAGGLYDNLRHFGPVVQFRADISKETRMLLFDPQTSGGLLLAVPRRKLAGLLERAEQLKQPVWVVGDAFQGEGIEVK